MTTEKVLKELQKIPNVGPAVARDLFSLGVRGIDDLAGKSPDKLYARLENLAGGHVDRCMLYVLRALVYMAETGDRRPDRVLWWHFKDGV